MNTEHTAEQVSPFTLLQSEADKIGYALMPKAITNGMNAVMSLEDWEWADLLAVAGAITEEDHRLVQKVESQAATIQSLQAQVEELQQRNEQLEEVLGGVSNWCKAYPITIFTEPDWDDVKEKLGSNLLTAVSGSNMRHITDGIQKLINPALSASPTGGK